MPATHRFKLKAVEPKTLTVVLKLLDADELGGKPDEYELLLDVVYVLSAASSFLFFSFERLSTDWSIRKYSCVCSCVSLYTNALLRFLNEHKNRDVPCSYF